jgi:hypothetical protein
VGEGNVLEFREGGEGEEEGGEEGKHGGGLGSWIVARGSGFIDWSDGVVG